MPAAQPAQVRETGGAALCEGDDVIDLEAVAGVATRHHAGRVTGDERGADVGGDGAPQMSHRFDVDAIADDGRDDGVRSQGAGARDGDGPDAGYLAHVARFDMTPAERGVVDPYVNGGPGYRAGGARLRARVARHGNERVGEVRPVRLTPSCGARFDEDLCSEGLEARQELGAVFGQQTPVEAEGAVEIGSVA